MTYGFDAEHLMVWIDSYDRVTTDRAGVLCRRHADAMVVPLGWMLDDRRDPVPRLFKAPAQPTCDGAAAAAHVTGTIATTPASWSSVPMLLSPSWTTSSAHPRSRSARRRREVMPWKPAFDQTDDLDGLLEARGPLLARAFGGQGRRRPNS